MIDNSSVWRLSPEVRGAILHGRPVVALETAVVTHGLPPPYHLQAVARMEAAIRDQGAVPAVCLVQDGCIAIGASEQAVKSLAENPSREKASVRDLGWAVARGIPAGLTVSATLFAAAASGIDVFATGGIGGVHRGAAESGDVSSDLLQLSRSPVITICAGAKSVLDIPRTLEHLETLGVPVFGYQTETFPAFYLRSSGLAVPMLDVATAVARTARAQWDLGYRAGLVIGNPIPPESEIDPSLWGGWIEQAEKMARQDAVSGKEVTPFLLARVAELSEGETVRANLALLESNARVAAEIATTLHP